ncbi:MAG: replicative DNA helicase [Planctomycetaceae bacterium]
MMPTGSIALPHSDDAEAAMVGSLLLDASRLDEVAAMIRPEDIIHDATRTVFETIRRLVAGGSVVDFVTVRDRMIRDGTLADCGGVAFLVGLAEGVPSAASVAHYARIVARNACKRRLWKMAGRIQTGAIDPTEDPSATISAAIKALQQLDDEDASGERKPVLEYDALRGVVNRRVTVVDRVPVGFGQLRRLLVGGIPIPSLTVVAGYTSTGKTSLALGMAIDAVNHVDGFPALYVSLEQPIGQLAERLLSMRSGVPIYEILTGSLEQDQFEARRMDAMHAASGSRGLYLLDRVTQLRGICAAVRRAVRTKGVRMVVIDYLAKVQADHRTGDRYDLFLGETVNELSRLVADEGIALILLAQFSREAMKESREPQLSDIRDSGMIEQAADIIILIHAPEKQKSNRGVVGNDRTAESALFVRKHRLGGKLGVVNVLYDKYELRYKEALNRDAQPHDTMPDAPAENQGELYEDDGGRSRAPWD